MNRIVRDVRRSLKNLSLPPNSLKRADRHFAYVMPAIVGLLLVALAVPRALTEVRLVPADSVLEKIRRTPVEELNSADNQKSLKGAVQDLEAASRIHNGNADIYADLAFAELGQLDVVGPNTTEGKALLDSAIGNLEESLKRNPANSFAWVRLASALVYKEGKVTPDALEALRWSYRTGPLIEKLAYFRTDLGIRLYGELDFDLKQSLSEEIAFYFSINWPARLELMALTCKLEAAFIVQNALSGVLEQKELDQFYRNFMSPAACAHAAKSKAAKEN